MTNSMVWQSLLPITSHKRTWGNSWTSHHRPHRYVHAKAPWQSCNSSFHGSHLVPRDVDTRTVRPAHDRVPGSQGRDEAWIDHVFWINIKGGAKKGDIVTWSGFNSSLEDASIKPPAKIGILPIFPDKSTNSPLVKHVMLLVQKCIQFLNPGQTPVIGADQPLYTLAKQIQWKFPAVLGGGKYVVLMGALHMEDKGQLMIGKFIRGSGWEWAMSAAEVFTCGRDCSILDEHHIKRPRYAHQVHWWHSLSSNRRLTWPTVQKLKVLQKHLSSGVTFVLGILQCSSTGLRLSN